jgi:hypothetical protein
MPARQGGAVSRKIQTSEAAFPPIRDTGASLTRVEPARVQEALGAVLLVSPPRIGRTCGRRTHPVPKQTPLPTGPA